MKKITAYVCNNDESSMDNEEKVMPITYAVKNENINYARTIECYQLNFYSPFHWLSLAGKDFLASPILSLVYGMIFSIIPFIALQVIAVQTNMMLLIPMVVGLALIGPIFATGLYDIAWELEKGHKPTLSHSFKSIFRNKVGLWAFSVILLLMLTLWTRIATLIYAIYPHTSSPTFNDLAVFLGVGTLAGGVLSITVLVISAFTPQIIMERKVDIMSAIFTSANAVKNNFWEMCIWGAIIMFTVAVGFLTSAIGFIIIFPLLSFASWHAYIETISTKKGRSFK